MLGVNVSDIFNALQATLGGYYVNDFNLFGRTWQVNAPGRDARPDEARRHLPDRRPQQRRATWCRCAPSQHGDLVLGPPVGHPLQQLSRVIDQRLDRAPGVSVGLRARRDGAALGASFRRAIPTSGRAPRSRRRRRPARPLSSSRCPFCSPTCSWWRSTRAGRAGRRCCSRSASASRRHGGL